MAGQQRIAAKEIASAFAAMAQRDIDALPFHDAKRNADEFRLHRIERGSFRIDRDLPGVERRGNDVVEIGECGDRLVGAAVERRDQRQRGAGGGEFRRAGRRDLALRRLAIAGILARAGGRALRLLDLLFRFLDGLDGFDDCAIAAAPAGRADESRVGFNRLGGDAAGLGGALGDRREFHRLEEADERRAIRRCKAQIVERHVERDIALERHELFRNLDEFNAFRRREDFAAFWLFDLAGASQQRIEIAIFIDELCRGLDADAARARHIIGRITGERLDVDHLFRRHTEIILNFGEADAPLLPLARSGIVHRDAIADKLHQILVGGDDEHIGAARPGLIGIGGDEIVRLVAVLLDRQKAEGAHGGAHQRKLRDEIFRRLGAIGLVRRIEFLAEGILRLVEDDAEMRRLNARRALAHELKQLVAEEPYRAGRQAIRTVIVLRVLPNRLEIGAEDERRSVDQKDVISGFYWAMMQGHDVRAAQKTVLLLT